MNSKNKAKLDSFAEYCLKYPEQRFWQALRNWAREHEDADAQFILMASDIDFTVGRHDCHYKNIKDTFYNE